MNLDGQTMFNFAVGIIAFLFGWIMTGIKDSLIVLAKNDTSLTIKLQQIEVLVSGEYVRRADLLDVTKTLTNEMREGFNRLENKLDGKADKSTCDQVHFSKAHYD